jgi:hypothetical protein
MNQINQSDICVKSPVFGYFIRRRLFPVNKYDLLPITPGAPAPASDSAQAKRETCFKYKSRESGKEFFVAARYLLGAYSASVEWCQDVEFEKYQEMDSNAPVYILIGAGPQPAAPQQVFMFPFKDIRFNKVLHKYIEKYKISVTRSIEEKDLTHLACGQAA